MREEQVPAAVAPEHFQTHAGFVTCLTPELARALEAALSLPTGGFPGPLPMGSPARRPARQSIRS
jgi:hypothetical protein